MSYAVSPDQGAAPRKSAPPVAPIAPVGYTPGQVAASLAANPQASKGGYEGPTPMVDPVQANQDAAYDYSQDPILNKIRANTVRARVDAQAAALAQRTQEHIAFDDRSNPFSVLNQLDKTYADTNHNHEETLNQQNLWYSGAHAKQLADDADAYQHDLYNARGQDQQNLTSINSSLAQALLGYDNQDMQAEADAAGRASTRAQTYGYDPGAASSTPPPADTSGLNLSTAISSPTYSQPVAQSGGYSSLTAPQPSVPAHSAAATRQPPAAPKAAALKNPYLTNPNKRG